MNFPPQNKQRFERLRALSPMDAIQAWLDGSFGIGDEPALLEAIRRDPRVTGSDSKLTAIMLDAMDDELAAAACFARLCGAK